MNTFTSRTSFVLILLALTILSACGGGGGGSTTDNGSIKVTAITIYAQDATVIRGVKSLQLTAVIAPANAANQAIVWASSDSATASVSTTGLVTANVDSGSVTITATAQDGSQIRGSTTVNAVPFCSIATPCLRVTSDTSGNGNGSSWATPLPGLQAALEQANMQLAQITNNPPRAVRILLQTGTYRPSKKADSTACVVDTTYSDCTFVMQNNVEIYGGFAGTETSLADRILSANITALDGLLNPSATVTACSSDNAKCSQRVITNDYSGSGSFPLAANAILDGVIIRNGRNQNDAGGGMYNSNASPTIRNVTFSGNTADMGGGMGNNNFSFPLLINVTFFGNAAKNGGGMANNASYPTLTNVTFSGNAANNGGGGLYNDSSSPILTNVTFSGNRATLAGSKNVLNNSSNSLPIFVNALVWGDGILNIGGGSYKAYSSLIQGRAADANGNLDGVTATAASIFGGTATLADNGNPLVQTIAIATKGSAANNGALVWKSDTDYYTSRGNDIFKLNGIGKGKITALPAGATLISTGGANKNNTVTPTAGSPAIYPDIGAYQH